MPVQYNDTYVFPQLPSDTDADWPGTEPPIMRAQLIQYRRGDLDVNNFNQEGTNNSLSTFLYPVEDTTAGPACKHVERIRVATTVCYK